MSATRAVTPSALDGVGATIAKVIDRALRDGSVRRGPGTRPQPTLHVRVEGGRVQLRRVGQDD